ncbi:DUF554 family protein [Alkalibaculum sp. M08DMB]|uniref:DUF554 family protein n=1 Tax=Alkalibaculum sporogenes TaxID=2655001 RepID=A0A6A7K698_9FIRM|nr:DUF554 domain-containing protein [Alkalibaculum sporogenes]MPW24895.1 DUF554 family protein [Alkalibaculum sporogenes]
MTGNLLNVFAILLGGILGTVFKRRIPEKINRIMIDALALGVMVYGISEGIKMSNPLIIFISLGFGAIIGELIDIESKLNQLGDYLQSKMVNSNNISQGFVSSSLLFCVGAMSIMGALQSGLQDKHDILIAKSFLDGIMSIIFASTMGIGVLLSSITVFMYQGSIILLSEIIKPYLSNSVINEMTAVGGILIFAIGINILEIKKLKLGNLLPALFIPIIIHIFYPF